MGKTKEYYEQKLKELDLREKVKSAKDELAKFRGKNDRKTNK